jgi:hypothetical protein
MGSVWKCFQIRNAQEIKRISQKTKQNCNPSMLNSCQSSLNQDSHSNQPDPPASCKPSCAPSKQPLDTHGNNTLQPHTLHTSTISFHRRLLLCHKPGTYCPSYVRSSSTLRMQEWFDEGNGEHRRDCCANHMLGRRLPTRNPWDKVRRKLAVSTRA